MTEFRHKATSGFTLVETLVTILMLSASLAVLLPAMTRVMFVTDDTQRRLTATKIALQGIELMRVKRDNNILCIEYSCEGGIGDWYEGISVDSGSPSLWEPDAIDIGAILPGNEFAAFTGNYETFEGARELHVSNEGGLMGRFTYNTSNTVELSGSFKRVVRVERINDYSASVTSKVVWGSGETLEVSTILFDTL